MLLIVYLLLISLIREYPAAHYEPDEAMYSGSEDEREDEDVGYSDLDDW